MQMLKKLLDLRKNEDGNEAVTFVIVIPLFMFIFAMMVTISQLIYAGSVGLNAANAGCRQAIVQETERAANEAAYQAASTYVAASGMGCSFGGGELTKSGTWTRGNTCDYKVYINVKTAVPMGRFSNNYSIEKHSVMMIERAGR